MKSKKKKKKKNEYVDLKLERLTSDDILEIVLDEELNYYFKRVFGICPIEQIAYVCKSKGNTKL